MKLTTRGFTLVELMIVIAIIGILAAALFPSLTSYLAKGRDTARASHVKEIVTALSTFMVDSTGNAPINTITKCADFGDQLKTYLPKFPKDPISGRTDNCGSANLYGYGTGKVNGQNSAAVSAVFEGGGGNVAWSLDSYQWVDASGMSWIDALTKGATNTGYVVRN
jgi:prepilin-type N-terminal cleavage/methylation domain-containing protein